MEPMRKKNLIGARKTRSKPPIIQEDLVTRLQIAGLKIDQAMISRIESGTRLVTDFEVKAIARAPKVTMGWLLNEN